MECKNVTTFQLASAYIGVTVGAGFASGQEVLQFFSFFGPESFAAIILASCLFAAFAVLILKAGARLHANSHREVVYHSGGRVLGLAIDTTITFFLFGSYTAMLAGAGAALNQQFGLTPLLGAVLMAAISLVTVLPGLRGILSVLGFLAPLMLGAIIAMTVAVLALMPAGLSDIGNFARPWAAVLPYWPLSALTYVSYNLLVAVAILSPLGRLAKSPADIERGAIAGSLGLGVSILAINLILLTLPESFGYPIPMNYAANRLSPLVGSAYTLILMMAIYTTSVGSLYGFTARLAAPDSSRFKALVPLITFTGITASAIGFTNLVRFLYTGVGIAGFLLLGGLAYQYVRSRLQPKSNPLT